MVRVLLVSYVDVCFFLVPLGHLVILFNGSPKYETCLSAGTWGLCEEPMDAERD